MCVELLDARLELLNLGADRDQFELRIEDALLRDQTFAKELLFDGNTLTNDLCLIVQFFDLSVGVVALAVDRGHLEAGGVGANLTRAALLGAGFDESFLGRPDLLNKGRLGDTGYDLVCLDLLVGANVEVNNHSGSGRDDIQDAAGADDDPLSVYFRGNASLVAPDHRCAENEKQPYQCEPTLWTRHVQHHVELLGGREAVQRDFAKDTLAQRLGSRIQEAATHCCDVPRSSLSKR